MKKSPNIILISIDTLRADRLSCYGYHRQTSPHLDAVARESLVFKNAYSTASWTPPAHASMFTGLYPSQHGVVDQNRLSENIPTIAELLQRNGYRTAGLVNNSQVGQLTGLERGHEYFVEVWRGIEERQFFKRALALAQYHAKRLLHLADDGAQLTTKLAVNWLKKREREAQPFYLFLHYIDVHNPMRPPRPFRFRFLNKSLRRRIDMRKIWRVADNPLICYTDDLELSPDEIEAIKCLYDEELAYVDSQLGILFAYLRQAHLLDDTLLIITADHGEHFGEHGHFSHVASVYEPIIHIPLMIRPPGGMDHRREVEGLCQLTDIFPTIAAAAEIVEGNSSVERHGFDLLHSPNGQLANRQIIAEWEGRVPYFIQDRLKTRQQSTDLKRFTTKLTMIRQQAMKFIQPEIGTEELYDLQNDPHEATNLIEQRAEVADSLRAQLLAWQNHNMRPASQSETYEMDEAVKKNLEALGYL